TINISKSTIYNFNNKIAKLKVFDMYHKYITNEYFNLTEGQNKIFHIDSTLILNKLVLMQLHLIVRYINIKRQKYM
ncbi:MAG: hypothetical protein ACKPKO_03970, partial [Candidatus Fonsibacter sp.]